LDDNVTYKNQRMEEVYGSASKMPIYVYI